MRYQLSTTESAEVLRLLLPRVAKHGGAYVPTTYAVWFEYLTGLCPDLTKALDERLSAAETLSQADIDGLYDRHVGSREAQTCAQLQAGLATMLQRLGEAATNSGTGASEFVQSLEACQKDLQSVSDAAGLTRVLTTLTQSTAVALTSAESLQHEVAITREEVQKLRSEIGVLETTVGVDPLTRLRNRRGFEKAVQDYLQTGTSTLVGCSVVVADIDHFKKVNDTFGHLLGDQVIRAAADALQNGIKGRDIAARWGGEEFVILLPETSGQGAAVLAEQLRTAFAKTRIRRAGNTDVAGTVTISMGIAEIQSTEETVEQAIGRADKALYQAKGDGRNCVRVAA